MNGVIYMTWGASAVSQVEQSIQSLWTIAPATPVCIVGDADAEKKFAGREQITFIGVDVDPFGSDGRFMAGRIKPLLAQLSPFDRSLYVDADTAFQCSPQAGFDLLDKWDFVVAETDTRSLADTIAGFEETKWTREWLGTAQPLYHNSGMLFWRKNERTNKLFRLWSEEWKRFRDWDEQVALLRALLRSEAIYLNVPYSWNCHEKSDSWMLFHWFGSRTAWKHPKAKYKGTKTQRIRVQPGHGPIHVSAKTQDLCEVEATRLLP